jgi:hypothetical protein
LLDAGSTKIGEALRRAETEGPTVIVDLLRGRHPIVEIVDGDRGEKLE